MPTYGYVCESCSYEFEVIQRMTENALTQCPKCKQHKLERKLYGDIFCYAVGEAKTLVQQAERNSRKFGRDECVEREAVAKENLARARKRPKKPESETPWWRDGTIPGLIKKDTILSVKECEKYTTALAAEGCKVVANKKVPNDRRKK